MTPFPYSVNINATLSDARKYMEENQIHHLPVTDGEKIIGTINARDLENLKNENLCEIKLGVPQVFDLDERMDNVLETMSEKHLDTVLITKKSKLVGIFTYTDACRQFAKYLRDEFGPHGGNDAA